MLKQDQFVTPLLAWYDKNKREMVWRDRGNAYYTWISEIMLQQTRIEAAKDYFVRFTEELPDIQSLANVPQERLLKLWEGLGYYNRAKNLQKTAKILVEEYGAELPSDYEKLLALPGIGPYTAGAIASIAYDIKVGSLTLCLPLDFHNPLQHSPLRLIFLSNFKNFLVIVCHRVV